MDQERIESVMGRQIFDSRGNPTVEACVTLRMVRKLVRACVRRIDRHV